MKQKDIHVAHSPDSDDAFMFYALATKKIDTGDLKYIHLLKDIETLNRRAMKGELETTAASVHACAHLLERYDILPCGASMGEGYGPIVVARSPLQPEDLPRVTVAVPGLLTSAYLALRIAVGSFRHIVVPFDRIPAAVLAGQADAGLLIHEGQLTWKRDGLHHVMDLGVWWAERTSGLPLPLGVNIVRRDLGPETMGAVGRSLRRAIECSIA